jgi:hypothetical protein
MVGNPETGDKTSCEDISPLKSASLQRLIAHCWRVGTNPTNESITSGLRVIRAEPAPRLFALSDVRPVSLAFRAKADRARRRAVGGERRGERGTAGLRRSSPSFRRRCG